MRTPYKHIMVKFDGINVYPGETLTVWLNKGRRNEERDAVQVELRITEQGKPEIFCNSLKGQSFEGWGPLKDRP